jgi:hypothetical protein
MRQIIIVMVLYVTSDLIFPVMVQTNVNRLVEDGKNKESQQ